MKKMTINWFLLDQRRSRLNLTGGYELAKRLENDTILLNLDRAWIRGLTARLSRSTFYRLAKKRKIPFIPIGFTALGSPSIREHSMKLIERKGRECVFQAINYNGKTHYYLSGFDRNEWPRPLYFLAELPCKVNSIKEAREVLKPPSVLQAQAMGTHVYRQGDLFAIATKIKTAEILKQGGIIEEREVEGHRSWRHVRARSLYGTAHTASKVASMPDGTQLAWNYLYHEPSIIGQGRNRDHRPCPLKPRRWHLVARNTVPIVKPDPPRRSKTNSLESGEKR